MSIIRGRKEPLTKLESKFWNMYPELCVDDPEDELNELIAILRNEAIKYFKVKKAQNERLLSDT